MGYRLAMLDVIWFGPGDKITPRLPAEQEVYVLELDLPAALSEWETSVWNDLTASEQQRARRYRSAQAQAQFVFCRSALRRWLGACLGLSPPHVPLTTNANGKPYLHTAVRDGYGQQATLLHFNVAHTSGKGLIAFARYPVGIDVERIRPVENVEGLMQRYFSPSEYAQWQKSSADGRVDVFFRLWTGKEAVLKAVGRSLAAIGEFALELQHDLSAQVETHSSPELQGPWYIQAWKRDNQYWMTLAVKVLGKG
jgi:4'-phosphopantetheinyl transferase